MTGCQGKKTHPCPRDLSQSFNRFTFNNYVTDLLPKSIENGDVGIHVEDVIRVRRVLFGDPLTGLRSGGFEQVVLCLALIIHTVKSHHL